MCVFLRVVRGKEDHKVIKIKFDNLSREQKQAEKVSWESDYWNKMLCVQRWHVGLL